MSIPPPEPQTADFSGSCNSTSVPILCHGSLADSAVDVVATQGRGNVFACGKRKTWGGQRDGWTS